MKALEGELYHNPNLLCNDCEVKKCKKQKWVQRPCKWRENPEPMKVSLLEMSLPRSGVAVGKILEQMGMKIIAKRKYPHFELYGKELKKTREAA